MNFKKESLILAINYEYLSTLFIIGMMKIHLFFGLIAMASIIFKKVAAQPLIIKSECKYAMKHGGIFKGKDSITLFEFIKNIEAAAGYRLRPNQIEGFKMDFEKDDKNGDGLLDLQEMINQKLDKSEHLRMFELFDINQDGFLHIFETSRFTLLPKYIHTDQMDFEEYLKWEVGSKAQCFS